MEKNCKVSTLKNQFDCAFDKVNNANRELAEIALEVLEAMPEGRYKIPNGALYADIMTDYSLEVVEVSEIYKEGNEIVVVGSNDYESQISELSNSYYHIILKYIVEHILK